MSFAHRQRQAVELEERLEALAFLLALFDARETRVEAGNLVAQLSEHLLLGRHEVPGRRALSVPRPQLLAHRLHCRPDLLQA